MHEPGEPAPDDRHAGPAEPLGQLLALVAERVEPGGGQVDRRHRGQVVRAHDRPARVVVRDAVRQVEPSSDATVSAVSP